MSLLKKVISLDNKETEGTNLSDDSNQKLLESVRLLLANKQLDTNRATKLIMMASLNGDVSLLELLLPNKLVDLNIIDQDGFTALMIASNNKHESVVKLLLTNEQMDPNIANENGETALMVAAFGGHESVVRLLLGDNRLNPNITNKFGFTALRFAVEKCNKPLLKLLLADSRVTRTRPLENNHKAQESYDTALHAVQLNALFRGLIRAIIVLKRMRLRAAKVAYAPGGAGFVAAAASFNAAAGDS